MKSSTNTSASDSGLLYGQLDGSCVGGGSDGTWAGLLDSDVFGDVVAVVVSSDVLTCGRAFGPLFGASVGPSDKFADGSGGSGGAVSASSSNRCGGANFRCIRWLARSQTVSDMAQKVGGELIHPIVHTSGMAMSWGSPSYLGRTVARIGQCSGCRWSL